LASMAALFFELALLAMSEYTKLPIQQMLL
jgi:hypothetical protein